MYLYTDDDLTRINRDFLGPAGRRFPFVLQYRTYFIAAGVAFLTLILLFGIFRLPVDEFTVLLFLTIVGFATGGIVARLKRDVGFVGLVQAGWQEVAVPRAPQPSRNDEHLIRASIPMYASVDAQPRRRRWQRKQKQQGATR